MCCLPTIPIQNRELITRDQQLLYKDSVSQLALPNNSSEVKLKNRIFRDDELDYCDSINIDNIEWKFRKQIILGF
jgi:hypothetical protein